MSAVDRRRSLAYAFGLGTQLTVAGLAWWRAWTVGPRSAHINIGPGGRAWVLLNLVEMYVVAEAVLALLVVVVLVQKSIQAPVRRAVLAGSAKGLIASFALWITACGIEAVLT
jgi:hypothetical protein